MSTGQDNRLYHQEKIRALGKDNRNVIAEVATGVGKTLPCLQIIDDDDSVYPWYIVVPEVLQIQNIKDEIHKQGFDHLLTSYIVKGIICYASFSTLEDVECNILFDEVQSLSLLKTDIAKTVMYKRIIACSATIPDAVRQRLYSLGKYAEYKVTLDEAIDQGILPEPKINVYYTYPDNLVKKRYTIKKKGVYLTDSEYIKNLDSKIENYKKLAGKLYYEGKDNDWVYKQMSLVGSQRKAFVAESKTDDAKKVIESFLKDKRYICFTGSVAQCNILGGPHAVNYTKGKADNLSVLQRFNNFEINSLYTNKMGRAGLNLSGIDAGVIVQLGSGADNGLEFIQSVGRVLRSEFPLLFIMVAKGTKDEHYLENALKHINKKYIHYVQEQKEAKEP